MGESPRRSDEQPGPGHDAQADRMRIPADTVRMATDPVEHPLGTRARYDPLGAQEIVLVEVIGEEPALPGARPVDRTVEGNAAIDQLEAQPRLEMRVARRRQEGDIDAPHAQPRRRSVPGPRRTDADEGMRGLGDHLARTQRTQGAPQAGQTGKAAQCSAAPSTSASSLAASSARQTSTARA